MFAPHGRDAALAVALLDDAHIDARACATLGALTLSLCADTTLVVLAEEATRPVDLGPLRAWIDDQPSWSDLPFIVMTQKGGSTESNPLAARLSDLLGNVAFIERPFHPMTFASMARTAFKARQRQYEARAQMDELHESGERLATALQAGRLGAWEFDVDGLALNTTPLCKAVYGRKADDVFTFDDLLATIHPADRNRMMETARISVETGSDYAIEYRTVWPDGSAHWAEVHGRSVIVDGRVVRVVGVAADVTARKTIEDELRLLNETLEQRVADRAGELERSYNRVLEEVAHREHVEEQLRQAQKMEMIGQLTGGVAHDFNNLLMAVLGNLDLLRKHVPDDSRALRLIDGALQGARRGASLTQRLLAFARRQRLQVEPVNMAELVRGMDDLLEKSVGDRIELRLELQDDLPPALIDGNQVELALLNLVVNARDAMPDGGVLTIRAESATPGQDDGLAPGAYLRLTVSDTGSGMDAETLQRAIEPFFSTKELGKGTGLGLSMIHGLAVQLNGALRLSSEVGMGTIAELWLPVTMLAPGTVEIVEDEPLPVTATIPPKSRVLVVDDDALIAMSTVDMLEDLGHEVIEANSGLAALEVLKADPAIDLMITDFSMPGMSGVELAEAARRLSPDLPILLATGYAELPKGHEIELPRLNKPYSQGQLATEIRKIFASRVREPGELGA